ncbi:MAG: LCP family protein [Elusimicrobiota bacterium]
MKKINSGNPWFSAGSLLIIIGLLFIAISSFSPLKRHIISGERVNILLLCVSGFENSDSLDLIALLSYEPQTGFVDILTIPVETAISVSSDIDWRAFQKVDKVYARLSGQSQTKDEHMIEYVDEIERLVDNRIDIQYYFAFKYKAFMDLIEAAGGLEMEVYKHKKFKDEDNKVYMEISTGVHKMDGKTALEYLLYKKPLFADTARAERRHRLFHSLVRTLKSPENLIRASFNLKSFRENSFSNLRPQDFLAVFDEVTGFNMKKFRLQELPGVPKERWGISYWSVESSGANEVLDVILNSQELNLPIPAADRKRKLEKPVTAEVWNASGFPGIARETTRYLRKRNVDVVRYGNYGTICSHTQIIDRAGGRKSQQALSELSAILGCRNVKTDIDKSRMVDVNVVIGEDFNPPWEN